VLLPAAGAGLYALVRSEFFSRQAKGVVEEAKTRATELPNDLMTAVRETTQKPTQRDAGGQASGSSTRRTRSTRGGTARRRKASTSGRKSTGGR
jgi:hypothetical protein